MQDKTTNPYIESYPPMDRLARAMIWSILYQDQISHCVRTSILMGAMVVSLMWLVGLITFSAAFWSLLYGGLALSGVLWFLIDKRRTWLLNLKDPQLRDLAYRSMLAYVKLKGYRHQPVRSEAKESGNEGECTTCL